MTANMLTAYYSKGCDSEKMFSNLEISKNPDFKKHLNQYDVIHLDIQWCIEPAGGADFVISYITEKTIEELKKYYPNILTKEITSLPEALSNIHGATEAKFIIIIDEWDVFIRDKANNKKVQEDYINFLRGLFKGTEPTKYIQLAYLTGILPIKKLKTQSALNNFDEFTMLDAKIFAPYIGFTEEEVKGLCNKYEKDFDELKRWYDGYLLENCHVYNPKAVVNFMTWGRFQSYWSQTGTYESILPLITMDFDGLKTATIQMISGASVALDVNTFQNDMVTFTGKDDVLTLLIHLGYLSYNQMKKTVFIPNEEIRQEFIAATKKNKWNEFLSFQQISEDILNATLDMDQEAVAEGIEKIHMEFVSSIQYNDENSLSSVLTIAYLSAMQYYFKPVRELPTGRGFADFVFIPKPEYRKEMPALLVELKWNKTAKAAIEQIKDRKYTQTLENYIGSILLVGINYNKKEKLHECFIESFVK